MSCDPPRPRARGTAAGRIIERVWEDLPARFPSVGLDAFALMPNHVHGIITIVGAGLAPPKTRAQQHVCCDSQHAGHRLYVGRCCMRADGQIDIVKYSAYVFR